MDMSEYSLISILYKKRALSSPLPDSGNEVQVKFTEKENGGMELHPAVFVCPL
jgi:hypothetical protein